MKKIALFLAALPFAIVFACDSASNATPCEADADCAALADTPTCDVDLGICVADNDVCSEDVHCQVSGPFGDGSTNDECTSSADCNDAALGCAEGFEGTGFCVLLGAEADCALIDDVESVSLPEVGGNGNIDVCLEVGPTCNAGTCE